ncbi:fluoride efflux transporter CrcB [Halomonas sp. M1]|uniref:fluoride efflux transporter CrcB n=1 Tax=Halomonas sp. M1 TaxID=3035470 RepID=UPI002486B99C|nr:fluoride efflux transporter CrcB [Halomonas sp. M1]WFE71149.1 fluoride efflux transporter CrcB [Halomonas sp. M1]
MGYGFTSVLLVAIGGALGGMGRFAISNWMAQRFGSSFPWGTLAVNTSGAFIAGWLFGQLGQANAQLSALGLFTVIGVLGGYTTVSSFSLQTLALWQRGQWLRAALNIAATLLLGLAMAVLGFWLAGGAL